MTLGLICATEYEAKSIINYYKLRQITGLKNIKVYNNKNIVLVISGIGKIMATIGISYLTQNFDCKYIINIGVVGACKIKWKIGDILLVDQTIQYDVEIPFRNKYTNVIYNPLKLKYLEIEKYEEHIICATGDKVMNTSKKERLGNKLDIDIVDMELFAIGKYMDEIGILDRLIAIKGVSDDLIGDYKLKNSENTMKKLCIKLDKVYKTIK